MHISEDRVHTIRMKAQSVRDQMKLGDTTFVDFINDIIPELKNIFPQFAIVKMPDSAMPHTEAMADTECKQIVVRESTWTSLIRGEPRARFTIAHEIGHLFLGHTAYTARSNDPSMYRDAYTKVQETEANTFASAFLMPTNLAKGFETSEDIQKAFGVSRPAAAIRIDELKRQKRRQLGQKRPLPQNVVDFLKAAKERGVDIRRSDLD